MIGIKRPMEWRTLLSFAAPYKLRLFLLAICMLGSSIVTLAIPWLAGQMAANLLTSDTTSSNRILIVLLLALAVIALFNFATTWLTGVTSARLLADLRIKIYKHLQELPIGFHEMHRQGDILALMTYEIARLSSFLTGTLVSLPTLFLTVIGAALIMFRLDRQLALLVPMLVPVFYLLLKIVGRSLRGLAQMLQQAEANIVGIAEENLEMLPAIKAFAREDIEVKRYQAQVNCAMSLNVKQTRIHAALQPLIGFVAATGAVLLLYYAGRDMQAGHLTPSKLFSFILYAALLTRPVGDLANVYGQIQAARGTLARLQAVFAKPIENGYQVSGRIARSIGEITFSGVSFSYPEREVTLNNVDINIQAGEIVAFTGKNGAGKSTLMGLILRLYDPTSGVITLDGRDISEIYVRDLRHQIGFVPQRPLLFNGTIGANIGYGLEGADDKQIEAAAKLAQAYDFIIGLPCGFNTEIGDHGVRLSGGQRQRIALARAFVKDPPILILDEATSMYDDEGEAALIETCHGALLGRTVILITHRPASLALAHRILYLEEGGIFSLQAGQISAKPAR